MQTTSKANAAEKSEQLKQEPLLEKSNLIEKQQYDDIYVRDNFGDTGVYPKAGSLNRSPDIIPQGDNPVGDPYKYFITDNWKKDVGRNTYANQANYIYMRGQNLSTSPRDGKLHLYWAKASLILWPQDPLNSEKGWKHQHILTASGADYCPVKANNGGDKIVTADPFYWVPESIGTDDHYSLIGRVETEQNPNPIPDVHNMPSFAKYISQHPNMCWRNVVTFDPNSYATTATVRYDQGETEEYVYILIRCTGAPIGSEVSFSCGTSGPVPPIKLGKTRVTSEATFTAGDYYLIPKNFSANISYTYYSNRRHPSKPMTIEIVSIYPVDAGHDLYEFATPLANLGVPSHSIEEIHRKRKVNSAIGLVKGIVVGSHEMKAND